MLPITGGVVCVTFIIAGTDLVASGNGADGGQAVGYFLSVPGRRFSGGRIESERGRQRNIGG
jgi:hypothetical protein